MLNTTPTCNSCYIKLTLFKFRPRYNVTAQREWVGYLREYQGREDLWLYSGIRMYHGTHRPPRTHVSFLVSENWTGAAGHAVVFIHSMISRMNVTTVWRSKQAPSATTNQYCSSGSSPHFLHGWILVDNPKCGLVLPEDYRSLILVV